MTDKQLLPRIWAFAAVLVSFFLFVVACALPVLAFESGNEPHWFGAQILLMGLMGIFIGQFAWFANPLLWLAWLACLLRWWIASAIIAMLGLVVALSSFLIVGASIPMDEAAVRKETVSFLHAGFYVWLLAFLVAVAAPIALRIYSSVRQPDSRASS